MKPLFCALALFTMLAPAMAQDAATAPISSPFMPAIKLDSGIIITPIVRTPGDLETMLDVHFWQFHVQAPDPDTFVATRLEMRVPGQGPRLFGVGQADFFPEKLNIVVGIAPVIGNSLTTADDWKTYYRRSELSGETSANSRYSSSYSSSGGSNPIKNLQFRLTRYGSGGEYALPQTNGDIPLITTYGASKDNEEPPIIAELVLVITAKKLQSNK